MADLPPEEHPVMKALAEIGDVMLSGPEVKERVDAFLAKIGVRDYEKGELVAYPDLLTNVAWAVELEGSRGPMHVSASGTQIIFYEKRWSIHMCDAESMDYARQYAEMCGLEIAPEMCGLEIAPDAKGDTDDDDE